MARLVGLDRREGSERFGWLTGFTADRAFGVVAEHLDTGLVAADGDG